MNLAEVKTRVKRTFGDESGVQISDEDITRWVNDAQRAIVLSNEGLLEKTGTANLVANQQEYSLPEDLLILQGITCKGTVESTSYMKLQGYNLSQFNEYIDGWDGNLYGTGTPAIYTVFANLVRLFPVPAVDVTNGLKYFYNQTPTEIVGDSDQLALPIVYHNAIINYCLKQAYELDEDWQTSNLKNTEMASDLHLARGRDSWKNQETYPTLTILPDDQW
jgi:hypothetical protein